MSATLSQSRSASSMKRVTSTIVTPLSRTLSIRPDGATCWLAWAERARLRLLL